MGKQKREVPELNSSSTADIAFLLLVFFLMTTSMAVNKGLARRLPPPVPAEQKTEDLKVKERNVFVVLINSEDQLLVRGEYTELADLREKAKEGKIIFFSTHVLDVAEKLCNRIAIIKDGKLLVDGDMDRIIKDKSLEEIFMELVVDE